ncbi:MAG TPA: hypothetical protein VGO50_09370 [Pyrinomonadaceae bacterium]|jgi:hypothetical protein|nr:hypothetical protein [Pyrinomonadaceae bacterium]
MKRSLILIFAVLLLSSLNVPAQVEDAPQEIQAYVDREAKKQEVPGEINKLIYGDLNGDGVKDAVVQYNIQIGYPGNNFLSYIAVFLKTKGKYVLAATMENGAKLAPVLVPAAVRNKIITFDKYAAQGFDKVGTVKYRLSGKRLVKV